MVEDKNKFIQDFFEKHKFIFSEDNSYINKNVIQGAIFSKEVLTGVLYNRIRNALKKYVDGEIMTEQEFSDALSIMVKNDILFTYKNLEKTNRAIKMGMYDDELNEIKTKVEMAQIDWGDDIWGM